MKPFYRLAAVLALSAITTPALAAAPTFTTDPSQVKAGTYALDPAHGKITWSVNHLGFSTYVGQFSNVTGTLVLNPEAVAKTTLAVTVDMASLGTLNPDLDKALKGDSFFDIAKFPTARFVSTKVTRTAKTTADVAGNLTLHGVTKPIILHVTFNQAGALPQVNIYDAGFEGHATVKRSDFGMGQYTGFISDDIPLDLEGEFHLQP